jgi:DNA-binding MarR family transcriptional regulator
MKCQYNFDMHLIFAIMNGRVSAAINRNLYRNFRLNGIDISPEQWTVLLYLWEKDGVTQQELCNATYKDKPSMTRLINNMEHNGLVTRNSNENDKRVNLIHLTETGKKLEVRMRIITSRTLKEALKGISNEDLETCQSVLREVFENTKDETMK